MKSLSFRSLVATLMLGLLAPLAAHAAPPAAPVATSATAVTKSGFTARWDASAEATGYWFDLSTSPTFTAYVTGYENRDAAAATSLTVTGLNPDTIYFYRVRADNGEMSANSNVITVTTAGAEGIALLDDRFTLAAPHTGLATDANGYRVPTATSGVYATFGTGNFSYSNGLDAEGNPNPPAYLGVSAGTSRGIMTYFQPSTSPASLAVGESLRAVVTFRMIAGTIADSAGNMRWGFLNSGGNGTQFNLTGVNARYALATSNSLTTTPTGNTARGYSGYVVSTRASTIGSTDSIGFWKRTAATTSSGVNDTTTQILGPTGNDLVSTSAFSAIGSYGGGAVGALLNGTTVADSLDYVATFTVKRVSETQMDLSYRLSQAGNTVGAHSVSQTSGDLVTSFDSLMLFSLFGASPRFTNMLIEKVPGMPQVLTQPVAQGAAQGETRVLSVVAAGAGPLTYQWKRDGSALTDSASIHGTQTATLTLENLQAAQAGDYTVTVSNAGGSTDSAAAALTVTVLATPPAIATQPEAKTVDLGDPVSFTVEATGTSPLTYQWKRNGSTVANVSGRISGATSATLSIAATVADDAGSYTVTVSNSAGGVDSAAAELTVIVPTPPQVTQGPASQTVLLGSSVIFNVTATGTAPLAYQWQFNDGNIPNATGASYTINSAQVSDGGNYRVVVTGPGGTATSTNAVLTVELPTLPPEVPVASPPVGAVASGFTATWAASAGASGYRLDVATDSNFTQFVPGFQDRDVGTALARFVSGLSANTTYYYRVRAYNSAGTSASSPTSSATTAPQLQSSDVDVDVSAMSWFKLRAIDTITPDTNAKTVAFNQFGTSAALYVGYLPSDVAVAVGQTLTMSLTFTTGATVSTTSNSFRFGLFNSGGTRISANANTGDSNSLFENDRGYMFNYNFAGSSAALHGRRANTADNNLMGTTTDLYGPNFVDALLTSGVNAAFQPATTYTLTATITRFADRTTVSAALNGGGIMEYTVRGDDTASGSLANGTYDQLAMRINAGSVATSGITFSDLAFSVAAYQEPTPPQITAHPVARTIFNGQSTTFAVTAAGTGPLTYQWHRNGVALADGGRLSGVTTPTLSLTGALAADAGTYTVTVTNALGSEQSDPAVLTVNLATAPSITTAPVAQTVNEGATATFTVAATGTSPLSYQWARGGTPLTDDARLTGSITPTLTVVSADPLEAGTYSVTVSNVAGSASASATLTVTPAQAVPPAPVATAATAVSDVQFTANWNASASATGYLLDVSTDPAFGSFLAGYNARDVETNRSATLTGLTANTTYYYRVAATNSVGVSGYSATITTVAQLNIAPTITSQASTIFTAGVPSSFQVTASGAPAPTFSATGLPAWAALHASSGRLSGTAPLGTSGNFTFTITASNGNLPNSAQTFTLTVSPIPSITAALSVSTVAGTAGTPGATDATGAAARFRFPLGLGADAAGNLYVADTDNHVIRKVTAAGVATTLAGTAGSAGTADGTGAAARFNSPSSLAVDGTGNVYVADTLNHTLRRITPEGVVTTVAGTAGVAGSVNAVGLAASFNAPQGVALDAAATTLYVADTNNHTVRKVALDTGAVTALAGSAGVAGSANGTGTAARFNAPAGLAVAGNGTVYVADMENHTVRAITSAGVVTTLAGYPAATAAADGTGATARFNLPSAVALNAAGTNLYVLDSENHSVRRVVVSSGIVTTSAGLSGTSGSADGIGSTARFKAPAGLALNPAGDLAIADTENHTLRVGRLPVAIVITAQPQSVVVAAGGSATFSVTATGLPAPTYQWFFNGNAINGATASSYAVSNAQAQANAGNYYVVVSNTLGSVTSNTVTLTVPVAASNSTSGGGGGGAPSLWFFSALALLAAARRLGWRRG